MAIANKNRICQLKLMECSVKSKKSKVAYGLLALAGFTTVLSAIQRRGEVAASKPHQLGAADDVLVLGSGGVLGVAWHLATLTRLKAAGQWDDKRDHLRIGTSAGSVVAMLLGSGIELEALLALAAGSGGLLNGEFVKIPELPTNGAGKGGRSDAWYVARAISRMHVPYFGVILTSLVPKGDARLRELSDFIDSVSKGSWPEVPTWVTATELKSGKRHVFSSASGDTPGFAVAASCAVPALYKPLSSNEGIFVDGGVISSLHLDLAIEFGVKRITVLAPISGFMVPKWGDSFGVLLRKLLGNVQEFSLIKGRIKAKLNGIDLVIVRPRPAESALMGIGSLMDSSLVPELIRVTLAE